MTGAKTKIAILLVAVGVTVFLIWRLDLSQRLKLDLKNLKEVVEVATEEIKKDISTPPPLRLLRDAPQSLLTKAGVINWTNAQRKNFGLAPLRSSPKLDNAAQLKAQDMFNRQYFDHVSPTGGDISNLAQAVSYEYLQIGENLALGNYENDQTLVQAWMDSPGHRANILKSSYTEIGVAVMRGQFENKITWLAVQVFAKPLAACPQPDANIKSQIAVFEVRVDDLKRQAEQLLYEIERTPKRSPEYNRKVDEYNALVEQINTLIVDLKSLVAQYNQQVQIFNSCAGN